MNYMEAVYKRALVEKFEANFAKFLPTLFNFYHKGVPGLMVVAAQSNERFTFYTILSAMANDKNFEEIFSSLKNSLTKNPIYNKDYWHLTDGYLSEDNPELRKFMANINKYLTKAVSSIDEFVQSGRIKDKKRFLISCLQDLDEIIMQDRENAEKDLPMSSFEFAEITMIKYLKEQLTQMFEGKNTITVIVPNF